MGLNLLDRVIEAEFKEIRPEVVDDMVLVTDSALLEGMHLAARTLGVLIEPSAAAGPAAIACHDLPGTTLATVLTGTDPGAILLAESRQDRRAQS